MPTNGIKSSHTTSPNHKPANPAIQVKRRESISRRTNRKDLKATLRSSSGAPQLPRLAPLTIDLAPDAQAFAASSSNPAPSGPTHIPAPQRPSLDKTDEKPSPKAVAFQFPPTMDDRQSLCQSPTWESYDLRKKEKKEEKEMARKSREPEADTKPRKRRLSKPPPTSNSRFGAHSNQSDTLVLESGNRTHQIRERPASALGFADLLPEVGQPHHSRRRSGSFSSLLKSFDRRNSMDTPRENGFIGGIKLEQQRQADHQTSLDSVTKLPEQDVHPVFRTSTLNLNIPAAQQPQLASPLINDAKNSPRRAYPPNAFQTATNKARTLQSPAPKSASEPGTIEKWRALVSSRWSQLPLPQKRSSSDVLGDQANKSGGKNTAKSTRPVISAPLISPPLKSRPSEPSKSAPHLPAPTTAAAAPGFPPPSSRAIRQEPSRRYVDTLRTQRQSPETTYKFPVRRATDDEWRPVEKQAVPDVTTSPVEEVPPLKECGSASLSFGSNLSTEFFSAESSPPPAPPRRSSKRHAAGRNGKRAPLRVPQASDSAVELYRESSASSQDSLADTKPPFSKVGNIQLMGMGYSDTTLDEIKFSDHPPTSSSETSSIYFHSPSPPGTPDTSRPQSEKAITPVVSDVEEFLELVDEQRYKQLGPESMPKSFRGRTAVTVSADGEQVVEPLRLDSDRSADLDPIAEAARKVMAAFADSGSGRNSASDSGANTPKPRNPPLNLMKNNPASRHEATNPESWNLAPIDALRLPKNPSAPMKTWPAGYLAAARKAAPAAPPPQPWNQVVVPPPQMCGPGSPTVQQGPAHAPDLVLQPIRPAAGLAAPYQQPIAKVFVECCGCKYYHDMPSKLYEAMANPEGFVSPGEGFAGDISMTVRCPWCKHEMNTRCCAGLAAMVYVKERLH